MTDEIKHPPSALIGEAASLFYLLGGMAAKHLVIVGGLVPPLLVPEAADTHIGSADIDLCLSLAITKGATREYYQSIEEVLEPYFELERASGFRWRKKESAPGLPLILDFLAPVAEDDTLLPMSRGLVGGLGIAQGLRGYGSLDRHSATESIRPGTGRTKAQTHMVALGPDRAPDPVSSIAEPLRESQRVELLL